MKINAVAEVWSEYNVADALTKFTKQGELVNAIENLMLDYFIQ